MYCPVAWCAETLIHYQLDSKLKDAEVYPVAKMVAKMLNKKYDINVKKTDKILDVPLLESRLGELDRERLLDKHIIEFLLGITTRMFTIEELGEWMNRATDKFNKNYEWWKHLEV